MHMWKMVLSCVLAVPALAAPAISDGGVVNAASNIAFGLPNYGIARGSLFVVKGTGFGSGATVSVNVGGQSTDANVISATETQIAAVLPAGVTAGDGKVTVSFNGETSAEASIKVVDRAFGIFTLSGGAAVTLPAVTVAQSAQPGQALSLYGTGLGEGDIELWVGGKKIDVTSKGPSTGAGLDAIGFPFPPGTPGIDQIDFQVPEGVQGCRVSVAVRTGDFISNFASIPVMPEAAACTDANGYSADDYGKLLAGETFKVGSITLSRSSTKIDVPGLGSIDMTSDNGSASFFSYQTAELIANASSFSPTSMGSCMVYSLKFDGQNIPTVQMKSTPLDAGAAIALSGPKGNKQLTKQKDGSYAAQLSGGGMPAIPGQPSIPGMPGAGDSSYLEAGSYTVTGPGGADVGAFTTNLTISAPLTWVNRDEISDIDRASGVTVNWSGGNPDNYATITGISVGDGVAGMFSCTEKVSAGTFTVPSVVLLSLPPGGALGGTLGLNTGAMARFTADGIDVGMLSSSVSSTKNVAYK